MKTIKFSHIYNKMRFPGSSRTYDFGKLLFIFKTKFERLEPDLVEYDTSYLDENNHLQHYELPANGDCLVLVFYIPEFNMLMTTIRRSTPEKSEYYHSCIGKMFEFVVGDLK